MHFILHVLLSSELKNCVPTTKSSRRQVNSKFSIFSRNNGNRQFFATRKVTKKSFGNCCTRKAKTDHLSRWIIHNILTFNSIFIKVFPLYYYQKTSFNVYFKMDGLNRTKQIKCYMILVSNKNIPIIISYYYRKHIFYMFGIYVLDIFM